MAYKWESYKIVIVPVKRGRSTKERLVTTRWEQRTFCRHCRGAGCLLCNFQGYVGKNRSQILRIGDVSRVINGYWFRFLGEGDERPDGVMYGNVIMQLHVEGLPAPKAADPGLGHSGYVSRNCQPGLRFNRVDDGGTQGAGAVVVKLVITSQEAKAGCAKELSVAVSNVCEDCDGGGKAPSGGFCQTCKGRGLVQNNLRLLVPVPPCTKNKTRLTFDGQGNVRPMDGKWLRDDIFVIIKIKGRFF